MTPHIAPSPFPLPTKTGSKVVNEVCRCGHLRSMHRDQVDHPSGYGHAGCEDCTCKKFVWKALVLEK